MRKTTTASPAKKSAPKKRNASTSATPRVCKNIYLLQNGQYNGRKMINGTSYSENFKTIKAAKAWLTTL